MKISRSQLFLTELIAAIVLFALCMAVCAGVFLRANQMSRESQRQTSALYAAQSAAETFAADPRMDQLASQLEGHLTQETALVVGYDGNWTPCSPEEAKFLLRGELAQEGSYWELQLTVETADGALLSSLTQGLYVDEGGQRHVS